MRATKETPKVGELRPSQIMYAFGVGSVVDLPYISSIVIGIDDWPADPGLATPISETRLLQAVRWVLGPQVQTLLHPPAVPEAAGIPNPFDPLQGIGIPVAAFPRWLVCSECRLLAPLGSGLFELWSDPFHPERTRYRHMNCPKARRPPMALPARFMVACENGHLDDFPWREFVHGGPTNCTGSLRLLEFGPSGEARDVYVQCDACQERRALSNAFGPRGRASMPTCRGRRPHLRDYEECDLQARAILLGASNLWFGEVLTTLAIPSESVRLAQLVEEQWAILQNAQSQQNVALLRGAGVLSSFAGYADSEIWQTIQARRTREEFEDGPERIDLKTPEWNIFTNPTSATQSTDFRLREVAVPEGFEEELERVMLVERLREVRALIGFTRIDSPGELEESPQAATGRRAPISRSAPAWVPATQVRGEGIFLQFHEKAIQRWTARESTCERGDAFYQSHIRWRKARNIDPPEGSYPGMRFVLLHSLAHALMRQLALECGYTAASVRERIYSRDPNMEDAPPEPMAGVLIYTAAPDSEGTLGGLVSLGEPGELRRHLLAALRDARLCASDPLCAEHEPSQQGITLHAAACHACMFSPETSCERGNKYLDRSVLVETVERDDLGFFRSESV